MSKPDWKLAPSWAMWLAQDDDGNWCWYENKPEWAGDCWITESGKECYCRDPDPEETLELRPC